MDATAPPPAPPAGAQSSRPVQLEGPPQRFSRDALDPHELVTCAGTAHDRDLAERHARLARDQPAERLVGPALDRRSRHAHEEDAFALAHDLTSARARLKTNPQVGGLPGGKPATQANTTSA